jgi:hypothetical protein
LTVVPASLAALKSTINAEASDAYNPMLATSAAASLTPFEYYLRAIGKNDTFRLRQIQKQKSMRSFTYSSRERAGRTRH